MDNVLESNVDVLSDDLLRLIASYSPIVYCKFKLICKEWYGYLNGRFPTLRGREKMQEFLEMFTHKERWQVHRGECHLWCIPVIGCCNEVCIVRFLENIHELDDEMVRLLCTRRFYKIILEWLQSGKKMVSSLSRILKFVLESGYGKTSFENPAGDELVSFLIEKCDPTFDQEFCFRFACEHGHLSIVRRLLKHPKVNPAVQQNLPFVLAVEKEHTEIVRLLLDDDRVDPTDASQEAFHISCYNGLSNVFPILLRDPRIDPTRENSYCLRLAATENHIGILEQLLNDKRASPSTRNNEALRVAAKRRHFLVMMRLLNDERVDPSVGNYEAVKEILQDPLALGIIKILQKRGVTKENLLNAMTDPISIKRIEFLYNKLKL